MTKKRKRPKPKPKLSKELREAQKLWDAFTLGLGFRLWEGK